MTMPGLAARRGGVLANSSALRATRRRPVESTAPPSKWFRNTAGRPALAVGTWAAGEADAAGVHHPVTIVVTPTASAVRAPMPIRTPRLVAASLCIPSTSVDRGARQKSRDDGADSVWQPG